MTALIRNHVTIAGDGATSMVFAHGFGCDRNMWRFVSSAFEGRYETVLFDQVGAGASDLSAYSFEKYGSLDGYADDVVEIGRELALKDAVFVGHSVSAMIGIMAAQKAPGMFKALVLVAPSPCYINDGDYVGGFTRPQIDELLQALDSNYLGWSSSLAPMIMGNADRPELGEELTNSFCRTDPDIARHFATVTFLSDSRDILPQTTTPCLILQCADDVIAPKTVGEYMHRHMPKATLTLMKATGHCPNLSAPAETIAAIEAFLAHD